MVGTLVVITAAAWCLGPEPCDIECAPGDTIESEACGDDRNGGCNAAPPRFQQAACGQTICGTAWVGGGTRDTDWYLVEHPGGVITAVVVSEFPAVCLLVDGIDGCTPFVVGAPGCSTGCVNVSVARADLPAGQYAVFVAPAVPFCGSGIPAPLACGAGNEYRVSIDTAGPCCSGDIDADGTVGVADLLVLLAAWGPNAGHPADLDHDGTVGLTDLLALLAAWGGCPS